MKRLFFLLIVIANVSCSKNSKTSHNPDTLVPPPTQAPKNKFNDIELSEEQYLGAKIFADTSLSVPLGQSCMSCHSSANYFVDPLSTLPVSRGADINHFGSRNAPTVFYSLFIPSLQLLKNDEGEEDYSGGLFLDGRAQTLEDQAQGPFLNPIEMGSSKLNVVSRICQSSDYGSLFVKVFGLSKCKTDNNWSEADVDSTYEDISHAIASFERSNVFAPFKSKYDKVMPGLEAFTEQELRGQALFLDKDKGNCAACHSVEPDNRTQHALFTDYSYDNIGIPKNPQLSDLGHVLDDIGLAATTLRDQDRGRFRVPTLRNIARTAPYGHNGYFKTLEQIVDFYSSRDLKPPCSQNLSVEDAEKQNCWPQPEIPDTVNKTELGHLNLNASEQADLVAFLNTLTDL